MFNKYGEVHYLKILIFFSSHYLSLNDMNNTERWMTTSNTLTGGQIVSLDLQMHCNAYFPCLTYTKYYREYYREHLK